MPSNNISNLEPRDPVNVAQVERLGSDEPSVNVTVSVPVNVSTAVEPGSPDNLARTE